MTSAGERRQRWIVAAPAFACALALIAHWIIPNPPGIPPASHYENFLLIALIATGLVLEAQVFWPALKRAYRDKAPIYAAVIVLLCMWDVVTRKLALLPLPYFPPPEMVLASIVSDWKLLAESAYHSLILLLTGYAAGVVAGVVSGVLIGWSPRVRYWAMPLLKVVGPVPATAWIPLALVLFPSSFAGGVALIALAVWFPVTMLTSSGVSNVRVSYLDVARTLGAGRAYLIFRVAIPSALPSIFLGLFMGLCTSFLTLMVAEMLGVKSGLGWYVSWAQGWAEYSKVYAALIIIAAFFSTIMTLLFKLRDYVLVWQKGVIKW